MTTTTTTTTVPEAQRAWIQSLPTPRARLVWARRIEAEYIRITTESDHVVDASTAWADALRLCQRARSDLETAVVLPSNKPKRATITRIRKGGRL